MYKCINAVKTVYCDKSTSIKLCNNDDYHVYFLVFVAYQLFNIPWQTVVYQLYTDTTARGFDVAHTKCYIASYVT